MFFIVICGETSILHISKSRAVGKFLLMFSESASSGKNFSIAQCNFYSKISILNKYSKSYKFYYMILCQNNVKIYFNEFNWLGKPFIDITAKERFMVLPEIC